MKKLLTIGAFVLAGGIATGAEAAESGEQAPAFSNKLPVTPVNCAAAFSLAPFNQGNGSNFERMRSYFYALAVAKSGEKKADDEINVAKAQIGGFSLEQKMSQGRACGYKFLESNSIFGPVPKT